MSNFMHKLAESLRVREQYLEDHSSHPVFSTKEGNSFREDYEALVGEVKNFSDRVRGLAETGKEYDEHFTREISDENDHLSVKIDAWARKLEKE